jgi:hypothetical protein
VALESPIQRLVDEATIFAKALKDKKYTDMLRWLSSVGFSSHLKGISDSRVAGPGKWLLEHSTRLGQ